jgi:hypothetical protein
MNSGALTPRHQPEPGGTPSLAVRLPMLAVSVNPGPK